MLHHHQRPATYSLSSIGAISGLTLETALGLRLECLAEGALEVVSPWYTTILPTEEGSAPNYSKLAEGWESFARKWRKYCPIKD